MRGNNQIIAQLLGGRAQQPKRSPIAEALMGRNAQMDNYDQGGPASDPQAHRQWLQQQTQQGYMKPPEPDDYMRGEMGEQDFQGYQQMNRQQRLDYLNNPGNGFVPPAPMDLRELIPQEESRFNDAAAYRTADASQAMQGVSRPFNSGGDTVLDRELGKRDMAARNALNQLQIIFDEVQANPDVVDSTHTWTGRAENMLNTMRDRSGVEAFELSPEQKENIGNTASYKQKLLTSVNQYIKEITGAQVGQGQETQRLMAVQPNENDSPSQLTAKLKGALDIARMEVARINVMRQSGAEDPPTDMELRSFLMDKGRQYYEEAVAQGVDPQQARLDAAQRLNQEFGL